MSKNQLAVFKSVKGTNKDLFGWTIRDDIKAFNVLTRYRDYEVYGIGGFCFKKDNVTVWVHPKYHPITKERVDWDERTYYKIG